MDMSADQQAAQVITCTAVCFVPISTADIRLSQVARNRQHALDKRCQLLLERCVAAHYQRTCEGRPRPRFDGMLFENGGLCLRLFASEPTPAHLHEVLMHLSIDSFSVAQTGLLTKFIGAPAPGGLRGWDLPLRPCCVTESTWESRLHQVRSPGQPPRQLTRVASVPLGARGPLFEP